MTEQIGIDPNRIYFREDIAKLWGYEYDPTAFDHLSAAQRQSSVEAEQDKLRKWFHRHFVAKGLRVCKTGGRQTVHGQVLSDWVRYNSNRDIE